MHQVPQLEEQLATARNDVSRLDTLNELALRLTRAGNSERAMPLAREAEDLARRCGDDDALALALCSVGMCHYLRADYVGGLEQCLHALVAGERARNPEAIASALISAAGCQYQMGAREEALQALYQALEAIEVNPCDRISMRAHNALGSILSDKGRFDDAEAHFLRALELGADIHDPVYVACIRMNYAGLHHERGMMIGRSGREEEARAQYRAGIAQCEVLSIEPEAFGKAHRACMLGELYRELGETDRARELFSEMLAHATATGNPHQQAEALMNLGQTYATLGNPVEAKRHFERALELASGAKVQRLIANGFLSLGAWFEAAGDIREALEHHKQYHAVHDALQREEMHATGKAHQIWLRFQQLRREVRGYREHAETLLRDNGELSRRVDRLVRDAHEDVLTGLSNRRYLDARLYELLADVRQQGHGLCVGLVDIDHFKSINDLHSHSVGDAVLRTVAGMIGAHCREHDVSARYGGDEFVICLVGARQDGAMKVLERLRALVAGHDWSGLRAGLRVTLSIGAAEAEPADSVGTLMHRVDVALYRAKRAGRDCVHADSGEALH